MQQRDLCMALRCSTSRYRAAATSRKREKKKQKEKKQELRADGELMEGRDGADIPLLGCSVRIHVPCCFTMEEKQRPPDGARASRGPCRGEAERAAWGVEVGGWGEAAERSGWRLDGAADHNCVLEDMRN